MAKMMKEMAYRDKMMMEKKGRTLSKKNTTSSVKTKTTMTITNIIRPSEEEDCNPTEEEDQHEVKKARKVIHFSSIHLFRRVSHVFMQGKAKEKNRR